MKSKKWIGISDKDEAFKEGIEKGKQEGLLNVALKLLDMTSMDIEKVSQITGLSKIEIHHFQEKSKENQ